MTSAGGIYGHTLLDVLIGAALGALWMWYVTADRRRRDVSRPPMSDASSSSRSELDGGLAYDIPLSRSEAEQIVEVFDAHLLLLDELDRRKVPKTEVLRPLPLLLRHILRARLDAPRPVDEP